jgi:hypothetical protein
MRGRGGEESRLVKVDQRSASPYRKSEACGRHCGEDLYAHNQGKLGIRVQFLNKMYKEKMQLGNFGKGRWSISNLKYFKPEVMGGKFRSPERLLSRNFRFRVNRASPERLGCVRTEICCDANWISPEESKAPKGERFAVMQIG